MPSGRHQRKRSVSSQLILPAFVGGLGSERPELWDALGDLFDGVWPEYNQHGEELNYYWHQLYDVFPEWQFMLVDPGDQTILEPRAGTRVASVLPGQPRKLSSGRLHTGNTARLGVVTCPDAEHLQRLGKAGAPGAAAGGRMPDAGKDALSIGLSLPDGYLVRNAG